VRIGLLLLLLFCLLPLNGGMSKAAAAEDPLKIGLTGKYPPFNYFDETGKLTGFDVDVAEHVCASTGRPCEFVILQWDGILAALLAGRIDLIIGSMAITPERSERALFSVPYYESGAQIFAASASADPSAPGFRIGVTLGTTYEQAIRESFPAAEVRTFRGDTEILQDIQAGRVDAIVTDRLVGGFMIRQFGAKLEPVGEPLYLEEMGIPARPGEQRLIASVNESIRSLRSSPEYDRLFQKYFGLGAPTTSSFRWSQAIPLLFRGLWATVQVASLGLLLGMLLSTVLAFMMAGMPPLVQTATRTLTDFVRSTPFLIQLFAVYFGLPALGLAIPPFTAAVLTIGLHSSAYLAEVLLAGYRGIPVEQRQASQLLGLGRWQTMRHVVFPQMIPLIMAPSLNTIVAMIKDSAIVSVISVYELTMQTQQLISATYRPFEFYLLAALLYGLITYPLLLLGRRMDRAAALREGQHGR
jgi:His/Glu/Gln/Arg/opine family amino acid ABC transporter permease subunit